MLMSAKKKSRDSKKEKAPRKETMSQQTLNADIAALEEAIAELKLFAVQSFQHIDELEIDGSQKLARAKILVREYSTNLWRTARRAQDRLDRN